jgi:Flp pilus assembly protein TadD
VRFCLLVCVGLMVGGCSVRHAPDLHDTRPSGTPAEDTTTTAGANLPADTSDVDGRAALPRAKQSASQTVEGSDPALAAALAAVAIDPSSSHLRAAAGEYRRLAIYDRAHQLLQRATFVDRRDALTYAALARLWRDAGFPGLGLADAHRAVFYAPASAEHRNTLGTVLQALGRRELARNQYEQAVTLDPQAWYAFNNLCYSWVLDNEPARAIAACGRALDLRPGLVAAQNNLALAFALAGDLEASERWFRASGDPARAMYNQGVLHLAWGQFASAVRSFEAAHALNPALEVARRRARQAAAAATGEE